MTIYKQKKINGMNDHRNFLGEQTNWSESKGPIFNLVALKGK